MLRKLLRKYYVLTDYKSRTSAIPCADQALFASFTGGRKVGAFQVPTSCSGNSTPGREKSWLPACIRVCQTERYLVTTGNEGHDSLRPWPYHSGMLLCSLPTTSTVGKYIAQDSMTIVTRLCDIISNGDDEDAASRGTSRDLEQEKSGEDIGDCMHSAQLTGVKVV